MERAATNTNLETAAYITALSPLFSSPGACKLLSATTVGPHSIEYLKILIAHICDLQYGV